MTWFYITDTQEECTSKLKALKAGMKIKGLWVNMKKTKFLVSNIGLDSSRNLASTPVLSVVVVSATTLWSARSLSCESTKGAVASLSDGGPNYVRPRCNHKAQSIDGRTVTWVDDDKTMIDVEATLCYLGNMLCSHGSCDSAIATRCCVASGKFSRLLPVFTTRHLSPIVCGKVYGASICSALLHDSEAWGTEHHWSASALSKWPPSSPGSVASKNRGETPSASLRQKLDTKDITTVLWSLCFRWPRHIQFSTSCIKSVTDLPISGTIMQGRPKKTWSGRMKTDVR